VGEIHLGPAQPARLTPAQTAQSDEPPQREQRIADHGVQERGEVLGGPHAHPWALAGALPLLHPPVGPHLGVGLEVARDLDVPGRVGLQHTLAHGQVQRRPQRGAQVRHGRGGLRQALAVGGLGDLGEHRA
jgi:hypothetical protein